ncbi:MAG: 16S rRNA (adenine(1518)-N(6)/adenine(1519)-N(6))-dimethyltransferase RsmA [Peptococcaceae bacterium]
MNLKDTLQKHNFKFKKKFGQNFITDSNLLQKIVDAGDVGPDDVVIEVGPGAATLTKALAQRAKAVIAVEIDRDLVPVIEETMTGFDNFYLVQGDALQIDLDAVIQEKLGAPHRCKVIANLPYYITTPLVMYFLEQGFSIDRIVIMVQKEVAERFTAQPGKKEYGAITVSLHYYGNVRYAFTVPRHMFIPQPDVDSAVVDIQPWTQKPLQADNEQLFHQVVKAAFGQRRKTLNNALKTLNMDNTLMQQALQEVEIDGTRRGETLSVDEFVAFSNAIAQRQ